MYIDILVQDAIIISTATNKKQKTKEVSTMRNLIKYLTLENVCYTLNHIEEMIRLVNINNDWNIEKYISLDVLDKNTWQVNFYGQHENLYFQKVQGNYFKRITL